MQPIVRTANARMRGLGSSQSCNFAKKINFILLFSSWNLRTYLDKCINCHDGHIRLALGIIHQIKIYKFLQFQVVCLHAVNNIREQCRYIFAYSHRCNHLEKKFILRLMNFFPFLQWHTFLTASLFFSFFSLLSSDLSSKISPFFVVVKYFESVILPLNMKIFFKQIQKLFSYKNLKGLLANE